MSDLHDDIELLEAPQAAARRSFRNGLLVGCGVSLVGLIGIVLVALLAVGVLMTTGHVPDTAAVAGDQLPPPTLDFLREEGIVEEDEEVLFFYSGGFLSLREDGNLFTDRRVISYWEDDDGLQVLTATYPQISSIEPHYVDGFLEDSEVTIELLDGDSFLLLVSNEGDQDERFVELLIETWEQLR